MRSGSIRPRLRRTTSFCFAKKGIWLSVGTGAGAVGGVYISFLTGRPFSRCSSTSTGTSDFFSPQ